MIIIYGGAFDPPHNGHTQSIGAVSAKYPQATILIVPGLQPAGVSGQHKTPSATFDDRVAMCEIAFRTDKFSQRVISRIEAEIPAPNYTVKTVQKIKELYPQQELYLLLGQDQMMKFPFWRQPKDILRSCSLLVVKRRGQLTEKTVLTNEAEKAAYLLDLKLHWTTKGSSGEFLDLNAHIDLLDVDLCDAESSIIRAALAEEKPLNPEWLAPEVAAYIKTHHLYG